MPLDLHQLAQDVLAASEGDAAKLAALRESLGRPRLTVENLRTQISADGVLTLEAIRNFLDQKFPSGPFRINGRSKSIEVNALIVDSDWSAVFDAMRDREITALNAGESITDDALLQLAQRNDVTVEKLDIAGWNGQLTDRGLSALPALPQLREIQLCWQQQVTDKGIAHLRACPQLEVVNLMGTNTGDAAIEALAGTSQLRKLSTGRQVTNQGIARLHEIPRFKQKHSESARFELMSFDSEPVHLLLDGSFDESGIRELNGLEGLSGLTFFWHTNKLNLQHLSAIPFLGLDGKYCDDEAMLHLGRMPGLRMLVAQGTIATAQGFRNLAQSQTIEYIWGRECEGFDSAAFRALATMPALKGFAISCKNVDALDALADFPTLTQFMPMDFTDDGFRHIGRCTNLESLWCMYCRETGDAATEHIAGLPKLKHYYAGKTLITDRSLEILSRMPSLERIELSECAGITDRGIEQLAKLPRLKQFTIHGSPNVTSAVETMFDAGVDVDYLRR